MLSETVTFAIESEPWLETPPVSDNVVSFPPLTVRLRNVAVAPTPTLTRRNSAAAASRRTVTPAPPSMVVAAASVRKSSPAVSVTVPRFAANVIASAPGVALASATASRNVTCPAA